MSGSPTIQPPGSDERPRGNGRCPICGVGLAHAIALTSFLNRRCAGRFSLGHRGGHTRGLLPLGFQTWLVAHLHAGCIFAIFNEDQPASVT